MLDKEAIVKITNRNHSYTSYVIPELNNMRRVFLPGETKEIPMDELRRLFWSPGGSALVKNYLIIHNEEALEELMPETEPEYHYTKQDIEDLLTNGSLEEVEDALDFAPKGVVSLIKDVAVETQVNDVAKRDAIKNMTGFDVNRAIEINKAAVEEVEPTEAKVRRATGVRTGSGETAAMPRRRVSAPTYGIKKN